MKDEHRAILEAATGTQRRYVRTRLLYDAAINTAQAAKLMRIHASTPHKWSNLAQLEEVIVSLQIDQIDGARWALTNLSLKAVQALATVLEKGDRDRRVPAANSILDRAGLPKLTTLDVTTKGQSLVPISFVEIVPPEDGE